MTSTSKLHDDVKEVLFSEQEIIDRVKALARKAAADFEGKRPLIVGVLKGCFMFFSDFCKSLDPVPQGAEVHFVRASSYEGKSTESSQKVTLNHIGGEKNLLEGRHVLLVEDIVDTGHTLLKILRALKDDGAKTVTVAALLDKRCRRDLTCTLLVDAIQSLPDLLEDTGAMEEVRASAKTTEDYLQNYIKYVGFECPNEFVIGYGMDFDEHYRTLPYVGVLKEQVYNTS